MAYTADLRIAVSGLNQISGLQKQLEATAATIGRVNTSLGDKGLLSNSLSNLQSVSSGASKAMRAAAQGTTAQKQAIDTYVRSLDAAQRAELNLTKAIQQRQRELGIANAAAAKQGGGFGGRLSGGVSNAVIGASFPLLFGQSGGAAIGGAVGGAVGGLFGGTGGFAGSLLGTLIGEIASKGDKVRQLGNDIGFSAEQTKVLATAFQQAGRDFDKFEAAVQNIRGLGLSLDDQADSIRLVSSLTETYGGRIDKVTDAFTSALESGRVTQSTLNKLTSEGIPIQDELARRYGVSRDAILKMAKDGTISVQTLADTLVDMGNKGLEAGEKPKTAFQSFTEALNNTATAVSNVATRLLSVLSPAIDAVINKATLALNSITELVNTEMLRTQIQGATGKILSPETLQRIEKDAMEIAARRFPSKAQGNQLVGGANFISPRAQQEFQILREQGIRNELQRFGYETGVLKTPKAITQQAIGRIAAPSQAEPTGSRSKGKKPPEDRTPILLAELKAIQEIGDAENAIRDALFQGKELTAAGYELSKKVADIKRDQTKALESANYASEKEVINQIAAKREEFARLEYADKRREIEQKLFEEYVRNKEAIQQSVQPMIDFRQEQELQTNAAQRYYRLVMEGMLPAEADRILQFEKMAVQQLTAIDQQIQLAEAAILEADARGASTVELDKQLNLLKKQRKAVVDEAAKGPGQGPTDAERLQGAIAAAKGELTQLQNPINQAIAGARAMGDAFQQAFMGLVTGAMTGREALASFFKGVGDHFLDMATKMIAKLIEIWILQKVTGMLGGGLFGGGIAQSFTGDFGGIGGGIGMPSFSGGIGGNLAGFAEGGLVTRPTMAMVGEGGEPEYVIPASKMRGAMERYASGARGAGVIPANADSGNTGSASTPGVIDVRYSVERINSVDYVTADEFRAGIRQAAAQGAAQGERQTLRRLQMSPSTRRKVGV